MSESIVIGIIYLAAMGVAAGLNYLVNFDLAITMAMCALLFGVAGYVKSEVNRSLALSLLKRDTSKKPNFRVVKGDDDGSK